MNTPETREFNCQDFEATAPKIESVSDGCIHGVPLGTQCWECEKAHRSANREVWAADEIPFDVALEVVMQSDIESRIATIRALLPAIFEEFRALNPIETEHGKYLNLEFNVHGYAGATVESRVYFGEGMSINFVNALDIEFPNVEVAR